MFVIKPLCEKELPVYTLSGFYVLNCFTKINQLWKSQLTAQSKNFKRIWSKKKLFPVYNLYSISIIRFTDDADMLSWAVLINVSFHPLRYHWSFRRNTRLKIVFQTYWDSKYIFLLICVCYSYINTKQWSGILILKKSATYLQKQQDSRNLTFILCIYLWLWIQDTNQISSMEKKKCRLQNWFFFQTSLYASHNVVC